MKQAYLFERTFEKLCHWQDVENSAIPKEAVAIASYIRTHRTNEKNAFDVLAIMWPKAKLEVNNWPPSKEFVGYIQENLADDDINSAVEFVVTFEDGSQAIVWSTRGNGDCINLV